MASLEDVYYWCRQLRALATEYEADFSSVEERVLQDRLWNILRVLQERYGVVLPEEPLPFGELLLRALETCSELRRQWVARENLLVLEEYLRRQRVNCPHRAVLNIAQSFTMPIVDPRAALFEYFGYRPQTWTISQLSQVLSPAEQERTGINDPHVTAVGMATAQALANERVFFQRLAAEWDCVVG